MGHLFLRMNMGPLQGTELDPVNFQKSLIAKRDREEQDKISQGPWNSWAMDNFVPQFSFLLEFQCFCSFWQVDILVKFSLCHNKKRQGCVSTTLHMFRSKNSANCDLDEIKLVVLLCSNFLKFS